MEIAGQMVEPEAEDETDHGDQGAVGEGEVEGVAQNRRTDRAGKKHRITFEARRVVKGFFDGDQVGGGQDVRSINLPSILGLCQIRQRRSRRLLQGIRLELRKLSPLGASASGLTTSYAELN